LSQAALRTVVAHPYAFVLPTAVLKGSRFIHAVTDEVTCDPAKLALATGEGARPTLQRPSIGSR